MASDFVPMRVIVKGEEDTKDYLLPKGNYITIDDKDYPLSHCGTLAVPLGYFDVMVHTPPPNTKFHVEGTAEENQLYYLTLELDSQRNITDASFGVETITEDPFGLYERDFQRFADYLPTITQWRSTHTPEPEVPKATPTVHVRKGGKLIGWGIAILVLFIFGIVGCYTGEIAMDYETLAENIQISNLDFYYGGAVIGLLMFIGGIIRRVKS